MPIVKPRPVPPSKPSKANIETRGSPSPPLAKKPRPQPPIKPRTSTTSIVPTPTEPQSPVTPVPRPRPVPRKRTLTSDTPSPVPIKEEPSKAEPILEEEEKKEKEVTELDAPQAVEEIKQEKEEIVPTKNDSDVLPVQTEEEGPSNETSPTEKPQSLVTKEDSIEIDRDEEESGESKPLGDKPDGQIEEVEESNPPEVKADQDRELETVEVEADKDQLPEEEEKVEIQSQPPTEDSEPVATNDSEDSDNLYEDMDMGGPPQSDSSKEATPPDSAYELVTFEPPGDTPPIRPPVTRHSYDMVPTENFSSNTVEISVQQQASLVPQPMETVSKGESTSSSLGLSSPGYEKMDPASPARGEEPPSSDEYVAMESGVLAEGARTDSVEYDEPDVWKQSPDVDYDVPPHPRPASGHDIHGYDKPSSMIAPSGSHMTELQVNDSPEGTRRSPSSLSSSGSTGSRKSPGSPGLPRKSSKGQTDFEKTPDSSTLHVGGEGEDGRRSSRASSSTERGRSPSNSSSKGLKRDSFGVRIVCNV